MLRLFYVSFFFILFSGIVFTEVFAETIPLTSPNQQHSVFITADASGLFYTVKYKGSDVIKKSALGVLLENGIPFISKPVIVSKNTETVNRTWKPVYGQWNSVPENYNEVQLSVRGQNERKLNIIFRAYNEGIAFCYEFPSAEKDGETFTLSRELSEFVLNEDVPVWAVYSAQGVYSKVSVSQVKPKCHCPLLVEMKDRTRIAIGEARLVDYARMLLERSYSSNGLQTQLDGNVIVKTSPDKPFRSPWRYIAAADSTGKLLEQSYLPLNLNPPCEIKDTSWIKPGKVIREVTLTTTGAKRCVDFAVDRNLQYVEFDAGWYGHEYDDNSDASGVHLDPKRSKGPLDLQEVIRYADSKGIGILVYVNQRALSKQLDVILPLYQKWGIKGIKFGFVNVGSQEATVWLHNAVKKCAEYKLMVDIHDEHRDTGFCRTYPNLMTVEGIRGNEEMPPAEHNVITATVRMLCGCGDYTPCWYNERIKTSQAHQLALPIVMYSPWTFLFWYDRPEMFKNEPELALWKEIPTVWDETKVLIDDLPDTVAVVRRSGKTLYIGILNSGKMRIAALPVGQLLQNGKKYEITLYTDDVDADKKSVLPDVKPMFPEQMYAHHIKESTGKKIKIGVFETSADEQMMLNVPLRSNGGAVVKIEEK